MTIDDVLKRAALGHRLSAPEALALTDVADPRPLMRVAAALRACSAPVIAVSPIIAGKAIKGPTAKMMAELGLPVDAPAVARHYGDIVDLYVADEMDAGAVGSLGVSVTFARTLMVSLEDREALARVVLEAADRGS
jgi:LPPG:FO 2-phospho-L-lactate transferase